MKDSKYVFVVVETDKENKNPQVLNVFRLNDDANEYSLAMQVINPDSQFHVYMTKLR